jgi:hypothetical protein
MEILQTIHGHTRWLVLLAVVVPALYMLYGAVAKRAYNQLAYRIMLIFSSVIGLQWVLGLLVFLLVNFNMAAWYRWEHTIVNTIALATAHGHIAMKKSIHAETPQPKLYWRALAIIGVTMLIIFIGVFRLPGNGWSR